MKIIYRFIIVLLLFAAMQVKASVMRSTTNVDGLSNSAILSMCSASNGLLWIGTCDGVNISDGNAVFQPKKLFPNISFSGNIVENMLEDKSGNMWIQTNYGLDCINITTGRNFQFPAYAGREKLRMGEGNDLFIYNEHGVLSYLSDGEAPAFKEIGKLDFAMPSVLEMTIDSSGVTFYTFDGISHCEMVKQNDGSFRLGKVTKTDSTRLIFAKIDGDDVLSVGEDCNVRLHSPGKPDEILVNIAGTVYAYGDISDIMRDRVGNLFVSFRTDGAVKCIRDNEYRIIDLGIRAGVFCLEKSLTQDVVWIGSDCQGVYSHIEGPYSMFSIKFANLDNKISHPVRSIYLDDEKSLWLGTKGDGVLKINNFNESKLADSYSTTLYTTGNSALAHNSVFAFYKSRLPLLWIATENGISYYSYTDRRIHNVALSQPIRSAYGLYEDEKQQLWIATVGSGVFKARITGGGAQVQLTDLECYRTEDENSSNFFFTLHHGCDDRLYFGSRGSGVFYFDNGKLVSIPIKNDYGTRSVNDVFSVLLDTSTMWLGTGNGLLKKSAEGERLFSGPEDGFVNSTIHAMLKDPAGDLWISTNRGLVRFDPTNNHSQVFTSNYGITVSEFSDGAAFATHGTLFFGGIDGIVLVSKNEAYRTSAKFEPPLRPLSLSIAGQTANIFEHLKGSCHSPELSLDCDQNYFALTFVAPDFLDASNYSYYYSLDGKEWISNGSSNIISFAALDYGNYTLSVKYVNRCTDVESKPLAMKIHIAAPWYLSWWAKSLYMLMALASILMAVSVYIKRQREKQAEAMERLKQANKDAVYEEKLRFFTNITHEFCTPLTLIYGPCERIMAYHGTDDYIGRYVGLIRSNVERLNSLIQELIDFRRMETGNKHLKIVRMAVSDVCKDIMVSFSYLAEQNHIEFVGEITPDLYWNTDYSCFYKIMNNLISNAFKYTKVGGKIKVGVAIDGDNLRISVYNTGKGISKADSEKIFNRYSVLDNVEENAIKGLSSRNGLGMAICHSMVELLKGSIGIQSEVGQYAEFIVTLPHCEVTEATEPTSETSTAVIGATPFAKPDALPEPIASNDFDDKEADDGEKPHILIIDDNAEILTLLRDSLSEYRITTASSADEGISAVMQCNPDLIITDVMMPGTDGMELTRQLKQNKHTMHIPVIILSAKNSTQEKIEGLESGADAYVGKPFNFSYLRAMIARLISSRTRLKEYYNTSASAFEYTGGKLLNKEDKDMMEKIIEFIDANIDDPDLSPEMLSKHLLTSVRNLYRKLKEIGELPPNDFIKAHRLAFAAKLLITTKLTVQEIIYRAGFTNRSHFYKEFDKRYGMTPKEYRTQNTQADASLNN